MDKIYEFPEPESVEQFDFRLFIYSANLLHSQQRYLQTLIKRKITLPSYYLQINQQNQPLENPIFFENSRYLFEWEFKENVKNVEVKHKLNSINQQFRFNERTKTFSGVIETGNDVGWFHLSIKYECGNIIHHIELAFEVLPSKMALDSDLPAMYLQLDEVYPLWRFNLAEKTEQSVGKNEKIEHFPLLWLAQFQQLQQDFIKALKIVVNSPHNRLQCKDKYQKAARIRGKLSERTVTKIRNDLQNGLSHKNYVMTEKRLSVDTPENRFIKMTVERSLQVLGKFDRTLRKENQNNNRLSAAFFENFEVWQKLLKQIKTQPFVRQVGDFQGLMQESLVLQQRAGYSRVFQIWQELKHYLDCFNHQSEISQKSVAEIYEVWCFLVLRQCLLDLGFKELFVKKAILQGSGDFSLTMKDGIRGAFHFEKEGIKIRLAHEPVFSPKNISIKSFITTQKPDILLEVVFPNNQKYIWLFDAKYRIKTEQEKGECEDIEHIDYVPDDAINQMHRYRDALIMLDEHQLNPKSRPVFGVFALYPGFFNQQAVKNPYQNAIKEIGIGAFALLPNEQGCFWLREFLKEKLSNPYEQLLTHHEARIADYGMQQRLYTNLVLMMSLGENRTAEYLANFAEGKLKWYHTPVSTFKLKMPDAVASEIQFLALAYQGRIEKIYPVKSVQKLPRSQITLEQSGILKEGSQEYYLFALSKPLRLDTPILNVPKLDERGIGFRHSIKLTTLDRLDDADDFEKIESVYV